MTEQVPGSGSNRQTEVACPACRKKFLADADSLARSAKITCPNCHRDFTLTVRTMRYSSLGKPGADSSKPGK